MVWSFAANMKLIVAIAVGLRPQDLPLAPQLSKLAGRGFCLPLETVFPAVTCSVQATFMTGELPQAHGVVGNGWYFRDLAQVLFWRQSNALVEGEKFYDALARDGYRTAKMFWWYNMYSSCAYSVTPRPEYYANGLKKPGLYSQPASLAEELQAELGDFPLFNFWGPTADIRSSRWILDASLRVAERSDPDLLLAYLPHLDYDHQRYGPDAPSSQSSVAELDRELGRLIEFAEGHGAELIVLSEYGLEATDGPVYLNRLLNDAGFLKTQATSHGQLLDAGASDAFAVCDHQAAHVYASPEVRPRVAELLRTTAGVARVLDPDQQREMGVAHDRSGDFVLIAEPGCWFAYHYWLDENDRPDFATTVDIHRKPGYDPTELLIDPGLKWPKVKVAWTLAKKRLGFRYLMDVIPTDASLVRGTHGRIFENPELGPIIIGSSPEILDGLSRPDRIAATQVRSLIEATVRRSVR